MRFVGVAVAMPLKKIDGRIRTLVENCVGSRHRSLFVVVGDNGRDQVGRAWPHAPSYV